MTAPATVYATAGDTGVVKAFRLDLDGVATDLTDEVVDCHMENADTGAVQNVTGLTGSPAGIVATPFAVDVLVEGRWFLEWQVVGGLTYPSKAGDRPILIVRPEVQ